MKSDVSKLGVLRSYLSAKWRLRHGCSAEWQDRRVRQHLERILPRSAWYRQKYEGLDLRDWARFPMIDKAEMMAHFDELNTVGIRKQAALEVAHQSEQTRDFSPTIGAITVGLSSGTSGNCGVFLASPQERAEWAGNILAKVLPRPLLSGQKIALFLRANSGLYEATRSRRIQFEFLDLLDPLDSHVAHLNRFKPDVIVAPPSMWRLLAARREAGDLRHLPEKMVSVAETLDLLDREVIERVFGRRLHEIYQCTEGFLAVTCGHGTLHVNEDVVVIQKDYIDRAAGRFAPVITDFRRTSQPIIRFRLDDILVERRGGPCPCGSAWLALEQIEGRCDDLCFFAAKGGGSRWVPVFPDFLRRAILSADEGIVDFVVRQTAACRVTVAFTTANGPGREQTEGKVVAAITSRAESMQAEAPMIEFEPMPERSPEMKRRRVMRECPLPAGMLWNTGES